MRVPTDGIAFKFGNAGRLSSDYAVLLPRAPNDWLRVEVVPGQTPFLISNAVLGKLRGVVDVEGRQLGFKGSDVWIPLFGVRKIFWGVKVTDLLMKTPKLNTRAQTHILLTQETQKGDEYSTCQNAQIFLHDLNQNSSDGIQNQESCFLKENVAENLQQNLVNPNAAIVLSEEVTTGEIRSEGPTSPRQGHGVTGAVSCPDVDVSSGRISEGPEGFSGCSDHSHSTAGGGQSGRVGNYEDPIGQAPVKDLCHGLREREVLCEPSVEQKGSRSMVEELPTLLSSSQRSQCRSP
jgi:hypothetical protein